METPSDPKPKRKYVMTPEHRAKVVANLDRARLAPKDKVYRKTPKRYAANLNNLGIAAAKRRQEAETLHARMEELFPAPELPLPPLPRAPQLSTDPPRHMPPSFFLDPFEEATKLIGKRLRKVRAGVRREGRRIMRLLTAALNRSQPLSAEEAGDLACRLLKCLEGTRITEEARRLNDKIARLLRKMIEVRYGVEPGDTPTELWLEQLREDRRARGAAARARTAARKAERERQARESGYGHPVTSGDAAGAPVRAEARVGPELVTEGGDEGAEGGGRKHKEPSIVAIPPLPETYEEFLDLVARALRLENEPKVAGPLAFNIWMRLHLWQDQSLTEEQWLDRFIQQEAAHPPDSYDNPFHELRDRAMKIPLILELDKHFDRWLDRLTNDVEKALDWWVSSIPWIEDQTALSPITFPAQPPARGTSDQPVSGSEDQSEVA
jgi:hypothetical protein